MNMKDFICKNLYPFFIMPITKYIIGENLLFKIFLRPPCMENVCVNVNTFKLVFLRLKCLQLLSFNAISLFTTYIKHLYLLSNVLNVRKLWKIEFIFQRLGFEKFKVWTVICLPTSFIICIQDKKYKQRL